MKTYNQTNDYRHIPQIVKDAIEARIEYYDLRDEEAEMRYRRRWADIYGLRWNEYQHHYTNGEPNSTDMLGDRLKWLDIHMPEDKDPISIERVIINEVMGDTR